MKSHSKRLLIASVIILAYTFAALFALAPSAIFGLRCTCSPWYVIPVARIEFGVSFLMFAVGILGMASWRKPRRANFCLVAGIAAFVLNLCGFIVTFSIRSDPDPFALVFLLVNASALLGYLSGVYRLKSVEKDIFI